MATVILSAAGAAIGGTIGGTVAGLSSVAIGRLVGATIGRSIDQRLMGAGSDVVETGRVDRFRIMGASEGTSITSLFGAMRMAGNVIWATRFEEHVKTSGGGKGGPPKPKTREFSYTVSLAVALCEGEISRVGRVWADGQEITTSDLNMRVYKGTQDQLPDPKIEAVEGAGTVPAYRGTAYVVIEDLELGTFGNRIPQFTFEVSSLQPETLPNAEHDVPHAVQGVALVPGTGEYALATEPVYYKNDPGKAWPANLNAPSGDTDFNTSFARLEDELPNCNSVSLVVSWFGNDLRCGDCELRPKVESQEFDGDMPWMVAGVSRNAAMEVPQDEEGRSVYGGTAADASVVQSIQAMNAAGKHVMFYPFILMEQLEGNGLPDPWSDSWHQPKLPWRGRITVSIAPEREGSPDGTSAADAEVNAFFGSASASDFSVLGTKVTYSGPDEWGYRRFVLHYAALCKAAGGVSAFCIGSEMRGLTRVRGADGSFVTVAQMMSLTEELRAILGADVKIGYAADWSEYFGYHPQDGSGDVYFNLDSLWGHSDIDFVGIDNYMPLSDWREGDDHADAAWESIYNLDYLKGNVAGGEGYDWFYHSQEAEAAQIRSDISDGAYEEPWVYRYKDILNWWRNDHHDRVGGVRDEDETDWVPQSKPIWFTELGCAAIDKGTNQPNKFLDAKSSESSLPKYSTGQRDDFIQRQYLRAMYEYWGATENNPTSVEYDGPMVDMSRAHVWAWDVRPFPQFPNNRELWSDGENYARGHWVNGRATARTLASVVAEVCERAGVLSYDVSGLYGIVRGYSIPDVTHGRSILQPLMLHYGFDALERDGTLIFAMRDGKPAQPVDLEHLAISDEMDGTLEKTRVSDADMVGRVRVSFVSADGEFEVMSEEAILPDEATHAVSVHELPLALTRSEARQTAERWLSESRVSREGVRLALPPSALGVGAGDIVELPSGDGVETGLYRVDQVTQGTLQLLDAVRVEPTVYEKPGFEDETGSFKAFAPPTPVFPLFMDLPLLTGEEVPHAPHIAVTADPWPGTVAVFDAATDADYKLNQLIAQRSVIGTTETVLSKASAGLVDMGDALQVKLISGELEATSWEGVLAGRNLAAIGDGTSGNWELIQFQNAELVAPDTYRISTRLRGQLGSDTLVPDAWPVGSFFVLLNGAQAQLDLNSAARNVARHYRIGTARRGYDDPSYTHKIEAFEGIGLKPYAPVHVKVSGEVGQDRSFQWIRRTRIDGDSWDLPEVPIGEESETYIVRVLDGQNVIREQMLVLPEWAYSASAQANDGVSGQSLTFSVAQISARFGQGAMATLGFDT